MHSRWLGLNFPSFPAPGQFMVGPLAATGGRPDSHMPACPLALNKFGQDIPPFANIFAFSLIGFQFSFFYFPAPRQFSRGRPAGETGDSAGRHGQAGQGTPGAAGQGMRGVPAGMRALLPLAPRKIAVGNSAYRREALAPPTKNFPRLFRRNSPCGRAPAVLSPQGRFYREFYPK